MTVMHIFEKAQPALLYLSPACVLSFVMTALIRGELMSAWSWSDGPEEPFDSVVDIGCDGNGAIAHDADVPQVEKENELDDSEMESKLKKKKKSKKAT